MNLAGIQSGLYDVLGYETSPDSKVSRRLLRGINVTQREILGMRGMSKLRRSVLTFASTANIPYAVLPQAAVHVAVIVDRVNQLPLDEISLQDLRRRDPGLLFTGSIPDAYVIVSYAAPLAAEPTIAAQLYVVSDSALDGAGLTAYVEGTVTGGYYRKTMIALNGVTPAAIDTNATWEHPTKFYLSAAAQGNVTLTQGSGGAELARISPGRTMARYTRIHLSGTPATALTYYADVELHVEDMLVANDEPIIPEDFHYLLEVGALKREWQKREKAAMWKIEQARWLQGISDLKAWVGRKSGLAGRPSGKGHSQLGPFFSDGS